MEDLKIEEMELLTLEEIKKETFTFIDNQTRILGLKLDAIEKEYEKV